MLEIHAARRSAGDRRAPLPRTADTAIGLSLLAALAVAAAGAAKGLATAAAAALGLGPLSAHMLQHIVVMNGAAPIMAYALVRTRASPGHGAPEGSFGLAGATAVQIVLLWGWHTPAVFSAAGASPLLMVAMHASLYAAALWFWSAVLAIRGARRWKSIFALLVTGKLFCLLAALLTFAGRPLYGTSLDAHALHTAPGVSIPPLADQQLAGLLMIVACPLTYVVAGVVIAARWLADIERLDAPWAAAPKHEG